MVECLLNFFFLIAVQIYGIFFGSTILIGGYFAMHTLQNMRILPPPPACAIIVYGDKSPPVGNFSAESAVRHPSAAIPDPESAVQGSLLPRFSVGSAKNSSECTVCWKNTPFRHSECPVLRQNTTFRHSECPVLRQNTPFRHSECPVLRQNTPFRHSECTVLRQNTPFRHSECLVLRQNTPFRHSECTVC